MAAQEMQQPAGLEQPGAEQAVAPDAAMAEGPDLKGLLVRLRSQEHSRLPR